MILQTVVIDIKPGLASEFESAVRTASSVLTTKKGYIGHELHKCVENRDEYVLLIRWTGIKDHLIGFRGHPDYKLWVQALEPFYAKPPQGKHYIDIRVEGREEAGRDLAEAALDDPEAGDGGPHEA